jgi:hypothetical protein
MSELDFSGLYWNAHNTKKPLVDLYPEINQYPELRYGGIYKQDSILKYINYLYSEGTPLIKKFKDNLLARKTEALKLAGIKLNDHVKSDLFEFKDPEFTKAVVKFLAIQNNPLWANIVVDNQFMEDNMLIVLSQSLDGKDKDIAQTAKIKGDLLRINSEVRDRLTGYYKEFFKNDTALQNAAKKVEFRATNPESVAKINRDF